MPLRPRRAELATYADRIPLLKNLIDPPRGLQAGEVLPDIPAQFIGRPARRTTLLGAAPPGVRLALLDLMTTDCSACIDMLPRLDRLARQWKDAGKPVAVLGISLDAQDSAAAYLVDVSRKHGPLPWPAAVLPPGTDERALEKSLELHSYPTHLLVDLQDHRIVVPADRLGSEKAIEDEVTKALARLTR